MRRLILFVFSSLGVVLSSASHACNNRGTATSLEIKSSNYKHVNHSTYKVRRVVKVKTNQLVTAVCLVNVNSTRPQNDTSPFSVRLEIRRRSIEQNMSVERLMTFKFNLAIGERKVVTNGSQFEYMNSVLKVRGFHTYHWATVMAGIDSGLLCYHIWVSWVTLNSFYGVADGSYSCHALVGSESKASKEVKLTVIEEPRDIVFQVRASDPNWTDVSVYLTANYTLMVLCGCYNMGIPQGRITILLGDTPMTSVPVLNVEAMTDPRGDSINRSGIFTMARMGAVKVLPAHNGKRVQCKIEHPALSLSRSHVLKVGYPPSSISHSPKKLRFHTSDVVRCECEANPPPHITWLQQPESEGSLDVHDDYLIIRRETPRARYVYRCHCNNTHGEKYYDLALDVVDPFGTELERPDIIVDYYVLLIAIPTLMLIWGLRRDDAD